jgi:hypothetical protein
MLILLFSELANVAGFASWNKSPDPFFARMVDQTKNKTRCSIALERVLLRFSWNL